jgi:hypothetical protein
MSDDTFVDGVRYITTTDAAARSSVSADYVAMLSRQGKVSAKRKGRMWYVDPASLDNFFAGQNVLKEKRSSELSSELRAVAERTQTSKDGIAQAHDALAGAVTQKHPSPHLAPEPRPTVPAEAIGHRFLAASLAILLTLGATAATSPDLRATIASDISSISQLGHGLANLAAAVEATTQTSNPEPMQSNVSPIQSAASEVQSATSPATQNYSATPSEPAQHATSD